MFHPLVSLPVIKNCVALIFRGFRQVSFVFFSQTLLWAGALSNNCLVAVELKIGEFEPEHLGKMEFYLEALDRDVKKE